MCSLTFGQRGASRAKRIFGYQKLLDADGNRGLVVLGFKFDTMADTEDPLRFAPRIGVRYPLALHRTG